MAKAAGATILRGGAFKPRTSPYAFQGLGVKGLEILADVREVTGLPVVTELVDARDIEVVAEYADMLQIGTRNMANFGLLQAAGEAGKPVLLKRGMTATIEEWLMAAEYVAQRGNLDIVLCERGIRTFEPSTRNTLDISAVPVVQVDQPPADHRRPLARRRAARPRRAPVPGRDRCRGRRRHRRRAPRPRARALRRTPGTLRRRAARPRPGRPAAPPGPRPHPPLTPGQRVGRIEASTLAACST